MTIPEQDIDDLAHRYLCYQRAIEKAITALEYAYGACADTFTRSDILSAKLILKEALE